MLLLLFMNIFIHIQQKYLFTFTGVFLIHYYICSHLRDVFIHIQRVIFIHIHDRNIHSALSAHHLCASLGPSSCSQGSHSLEKSLNFIVILEKSWITKNPWKVLEFHYTVLKSPWIFPNIESEASQQSCIVKITVFFCFNFVKMTNKKKLQRSKAEHEPKCEPTPNWSAVVYMSCNALVHATWSWLDITEFEALCWRLFCSEMPGKCCFNHKWLLIWLVQIDSLC